MPYKRPLLFLLSSLIFLSLTWILGYVIDRTQFFYLITHYGLFFCLYLAVFFYSTKKETILFYTTLGIVLRFILIFAFPNFSDDIYRFIWDGRLLVNGINPFDHLPSYYIAQEFVVPGLTPELYEHLNSPNYFTVYPPINQLLFAIAAYCSPNDFLGSSMILKSFLFLCEVGSIYLIVSLLKHFHLPEKNVLLYALNPLIIFEIMGNVHFEGAMIFFLLLSIWLIAVKKRLVLSAIAMAGAIASKLLPLIFLPFFIWRLAGEKNIKIEQSATLSDVWRAKIKAINWSNNLLFFGVLGVVLLGLFIPLFSGAFLSNFGTSLNLYFQKFEFNASIYYLIRWLGFQYKGYNVIQTLGPALSLSVFLTILWRVFNEKEANWSNLFSGLLFAICLYLFLAMTIHPWYVALPVVCCLFTRFRFPILWSGLIFLTYINYSYVSYFEDLRMVGIEYVLVGIFALYEIYVMRRCQRDTSNQTI